MIPDGILLALARTAPVVALHPALGQAGLSRYSKAAIALSLAWCFGPAFSGTVVDAGTLFGELAAGVAIAVIGRTVISAIQAGGELVDAAAGYGTAAIYSPLTENAAGPLGRLAAALAVACFWAFDAHRPLLQALVAPLRHTPANAPDVAATVAVVVAGALAFAGPALSVVLIVECALALAGRAAPQLNAFVLGLPLRAGLAILATLLAIPDVQGPFRGLWGREPALSSEAIEWLTGE